MDPRLTPRLAIAMTNLGRLIERVWQSPVFGDSYPSAASYRAFAEKMHDVHACFIDRFRPIVRDGLPELEPAQIERLLRQIGPKTTAFCSSVAVEIEDVERLATVSVVFGLLFLCDSLMDGGDLATVAAVHRLLEAHAPDLYIPAANNAKRLASRVLLGELDAAKARSPEPAIVEARLRALTATIGLLPRLSYPEDARVLLDSPVAGFLSHGSAMRQLSQRYLESEEDAFWDAHADDLVAHSIGSIQTAGTVAVVYSLYRGERPELPMIEQVLANPAVAHLCERLVDAAARIFDDVGDQDVDRSSGSRGWFDLNIFNHPDRRLVASYMRFVGMEDDVIARAQRDFDLDDRAGDERVVELFVDVVRGGVAQLPVECWQHAGVFLMLCKRVIESGYVNTLGDAALGE
ncbi:hypothetical protein [Sorangium sp. So ce1389]|uniref:hypothetical protein n=1 Tax=Sorangium sp. So ce1389 TaxID=3133336 RepID=UPI003F635A91